MAVCFDGRVLGIRYQAVCCLQRLVWCGVGLFVGLLFPEKYDDMHAWITLSVTSFLPIHFFMLYTYVMIISFVQEWLRAYAARHGKPLSRVARLCCYFGYPCFFFSLPYLL